MYIQDLDNSVKQSNLFYAADTQCGQNESYVPLPFACCPGVSLMGFLEQLRVSTDLFLLINPYLLYIEFMQALESEDIVGAIVYCLATPPRMQV